MLIIMCVQWGFSGINVFAHLEYHKCLTNPTELFDIAIIGAPFDTAVSYRPGKSNYTPHFPFPISLPAYAIFHLCTCIYNTYQKPV